MALYECMCAIVMQAQVAGKLAHFYNSATGIYDLINVCSTTEDEEEDGDSLQSPVRVMCDMDTEGGGWTVIMRRRRRLSVVTHVNVNFYRPWDHYENGFGNLNTEFWLGLRNIHCLTTRNDVDLMIDLRENNGNGMTWIYHKFKVNGSDDKYRLEIGEAEGPPGGYDGMAFHNGKQFSTYNSDNDGHANHQCARSRQGGWWYGYDCYPRGAHLTGPHGDSTRWNRLLWYMGEGTDIGCYKYYHNVEMKIRPKSCASICEKV